MQITADVFGRPAVRSASYDTTALGAAIVAAVALGLHDDVPGAVRAMVRPGRTFTPDPAHVPLYDRLYRQVYRKLYPRLRPIYERIREITGYPA